MNTESPIFHNFAQWGEGLIPISSGGGGGSIPRGFAISIAASYILHLFERDSELEEFGQGLGEGG